MKALDSKSDNNNNNNTILLFATRNVDMQWFQNKWTWPIWTRQSSYVATPFNTDTYGHTVVLL